MYNKQNLNEEDKLKQYERALKDINDLIDDNGDG